jgi:hypothetical protein
MDTITLALAFVTAAAVSGCVVLAFSKAIDGALSRLMAEEMAGAWSLYVKFAVFVASFTDGLHVKDMSQTDFNAHRALGEVFRSMTDSLGAASWCLLIFFGATFAAHIVMGLYAAFKPAPHGRTSERHIGMPAGRS